MSDLDRLTTNEGLINALNRAGVYYARRHQLDAPTLGRIISALVAVEGEGGSLPDWVTSNAKPDPSQTGPLVDRI